MAEASISVLRSGGPSCFCHSPAGAPPMVRTGPMRTGFTVTGAFIVTCLHPTEPTEQARPAQAASRRASESAFIEHRRVGEDDFPVRVRAEDGLAPQAGR